MPDGALFLGSGQTDLPPSPDVLIVPMRSERVSANHSFPSLPATIPDGPPPGEVYSVTLSDVVLILPILA